MKILKTTKKLPVKLNDDELLERGKQLVVNMRKVSAAETELKAETKKRNGDIALLGEITARVSRAIEDGEEDRDVECEIRKDFARSSVITVRTDTGEIIDTRTMDAAERQEEMYEAHPPREPAKGSGEDPFGEDGRSP